jgi:hypothetical protein
MSSAWVPQQGMQVEVRLEYPICAGSVVHYCWKVGTVTSTLVLKGHRFAAVELTVVSGVRLCGIVAIKESAVAPAHLPKLDIAFEGVVMPEVMREPCTP